MSLPILAAVASLTVTATASAPAFQVTPSVDVPVIAVATTVAASWFLQDLLPPAHCGPVCPKDGLLGIDRPFAGRYDTGFKMASDIGIGALLLSTFGTLFIVEEPANALNDAVVVLESALVASSLSVLTVSAVRRPRPLAYGEEAPLEARESGNSALSFFSGHTAMSFALATSLSEVVRRLDVDPVVYWIVVGVGAAAASFVGIARIAAGQHFPTDVIAGAIIGTSVGVIVPALHESTTAPTMVGAAGGVGLAWSF